MTAEFDYNVWRDSESSSKVHVSISNTKLWRLSKYTSGSNYPSSFDSRTGNYGSTWYQFWVHVYISIGNSDWKEIAYKPTDPSKWTSDGYGVGVNNFDIDWASNDNIPIKIKVWAQCNPDQGCSAGNYEKDVTSVGAPKYNPETKATNVSTGCVFSTNNSGRQDRVTRTDYLHNEIWFDWWGQSSGYPDSKWGIDYYNVDCNTVDDADHAHSDRLF